jgi:hypothetical protein
VRTGIRFVTRARGIAALVDPPDFQLPAYMNVKAHGPNDRCLDGEGIMPISVGEQLEYPDALRGCGHARAFLRDAERMKADARYLDQRTSAVLPVTEDSYRSWISLSQPAPERGAAGFGCQV